MAPADLFQVDSKIVLVTGAAGALASAMARALAAHGARLVLADIDSQALQTISNEVGALAGCLAVETDLADEVAAEALVDRIMGQFGRLDVAFCAAGSSQRPDSVYELESDEWRRVLRSNLDSAFLAAREAAKQMVEQGGGGKIVLLSSAGSFRVDRTRPNAAYAAAKAAVAALVRQLAVELAPFAITVNGLAPGAFRSPSSGPELWKFPRLEQQLKEAVPLGRIAEPEEIQGAALFLASPASNFITGQVLTIDGGWSL